MAITRPNFDPATGDDTTGALRKLDNNDVDIDSRKLDKSGGALTGNVTGTTATFSGAVNTGALKSVGTLTSDPLNSASLPGAAANGSRVLVLRCNSGNADAINMDTYRGSAGASWTTMDWTLYRYVDATNVAQISFTGTGNVGLGTNGTNRWITTAAAFTPGSDNSYDIGQPSARVRQIYAANGTISTSDANAKLDIEDSKLGLDFVLMLKPQSYRMAVANNVVESRQVGVEKVLTGSDDDGNETYEDRPVYQQEVTAVAGTRVHHGLLAQQVADSLRAFDIDPAKCGIWTCADPADPESAQGLRYEELIAPLINAIKAQQALIVAIQVRLDGSESPPT